MKRTLFAYAVIAASYGLPAWADGLYGVTFKYDTLGGEGFISSLFGKTGSQIIYSNVGGGSNWRTALTFASVKLPLRGGSGCTKPVKGHFVGPDSVAFDQVNSTCVTIERESDNVYYIKETGTARLEDGVVVHGYVAYHLYINGNFCNTNVDMAWRTFKNYPTRQFVATRILQNTCQPAQF